MQKKKFSVVLAVVLILALTAFGATTWAAGSAAKPKMGGVLKYGLSSYPPNFNPTRSSGTAALTVKEQIYTGLVAYWKGGEIIPDLATSWETPDDKTYIFHLRKGVKFHDGSPFTAEDVKFTMEYIQDPKNAATYRTHFKGIESIEVLDAYTVKVKLSKPQASFLAALARPECGMLSKKLIGGGTSLEKKMIGTGPFMFEALEPGVFVKLKKNPYYYRSGERYLDGIKFVAYKDENTRVTALRTGDVDIIEYVPWKDMASIEKDANLQLTSGGGPFMMIQFNVRKPPFNNPLVRKAIGYAVEREAVIAVAFHGRGWPIYGALLPEHNWAHSPDLKNYFEYNPEKAKKMLAEAGYPNGFKAKLLSTGQYKMHQQTAEVVQDYLKRIGLEIELELYEWATVVKKHNAGEYQFRIHGISMIYDDPDVLTETLGTGSSYSISTGFSDPKVDDMLAKARFSLNRDERKKIYHDLEKYLLETGASPFIYLCFREQGEAMGKNVHGYEHIPTSGGFMTGLTLRQTWLDK